MVFGVAGQIAALSLIVKIAVNPVLPETAALAPGLSMNPREQRATMQPLIRSANECIARRVSVDPRFNEELERGNVNELIVESIPSCLEPVRALIDGHDQLYGEGSGEQFFMGPYLDALPGAVHSLVRDIKR